MPSVEVSSINLGIGQKLKDKAYRDRFFLGMAKDQIAMMLRQARENRGLRQADLAQATGMKQSAISRFEKADYSAWSFASLMRIANALDIRINFTFELAEDVIARHEKAETPEALVAVDFASDDMGEAADAG